MDSTEDARAERIRAALVGRSRPCAFVDVDAFDDNARAMAARAGGKPIRVASKSVRCRFLLARALAAPGYAGVLAYSAAEAAFLVDHGVDDVVVAYPTVDRAGIDAVVERVARGAGVVLLVDDAVHVDAIGAAAAARGANVGVCIDVDMSSSFPGLWFGVRRSPLRSVDDVRALVARVRAHGRLRVDGVLGYEAQIAGVADDVDDAKARSAVVRALKARSVREVARRRGEIVAALRDDGVALRFVNGGGTGSLEATARDASVTELAAGSGLFAPALFDAYRGFRHRPAAGFALEVCRAPASRIATCLGGGYVASGAAGGDKLPRVWWPRGARLIGQEGAGEVQTPIAHDGALRIGDSVLFRHAKAGELCERFASLLLIAGGAVVDEVPTYRGDAQAFL